MKKLVFVFMATASLYVTAAEPIATYKPAPPGISEGPKNVVKFNPLALLISRYSFAYERVMSESTSLELEFAYINLSLENKDRLTGVNTTFAISGYRLAPNYRYYVTHASKPAPKGFYVNPFIEYSNYDINVTELDAGTLSTGKISISAFGIGSNLGYQWIIANVVPIDLYAGVGYSFNSIDDVTLTSSSATATTSKKVAVPSSAAPSGFALNFGFAVGYAF